jgi:hypothetical protein
LQADDPAALVLAEGERLEDVDGAFGQQRPGRRRLRVRVLVDRRAALATTWVTEPRVMA